MSMTLDEARAHIGDGVVYHPGRGPAEDGVITSVNNRYAFVRYRGDAGSKATDPAALELLHPHAAGRAGLGGHETETTK